MRDDALINISESNKVLLTSLMIEHKISPEAMSVAKSWKINNDGSVTFGKCKKLWWSKLFGETTTMDFFNLLGCICIGIAGKCEKTRNKEILNKLDLYISKYTRDYNGRNKIIKALFIANETGLLPNENGYYGSISEAELMVQIKTAEGSTKWTKLSNKCIAVQGLFSQK